MSTPIQPLAEERPRSTAIDAFRGFVMVLMMAEALEIPRVARAFPESRVWQALAFHTSHVAWFGCSLHDLIQPAFSFLVGVALPFSLAARRERGQSFWRMLGHACARGALLVALGILLRSVGEPQTNFVFTDTLSQIGLGYVLLFLLGSAGVRAAWVAFVTILAAVWLAYVLFPLPGPGFDYAAVGVPAEWPHHAEGLAAHWNKNSNLGWRFDTWWLNLFPRAQPFAFNNGGYATLNFVPTLATMLLGFIAGRWLRYEKGWRGVGGPLVATGLACLVAGWLLGASGVCPVIKRLWTPSFVLFSGGWCCLLLFAFCATTDLIGRRRWAFPLVVVGANSIFIYCLVHVANEFVISTLHTHLGQALFLRAGQAYEPILTGAALLLVYWLVLWWMYRQRILIRL